MKRLEKCIEYLDKQKLWILGVVIVSLTFLPYILMGEGSVFDTHDQLDETICSYLFSAKYMFTGIDIYPEMMNGINASGMLPSAVLFIPLYKIFDLFWAFVIQYYIVSISAFAGMYGVLKKLTKSSGIAFLIGVIFAMLPFKAVYGLSVVGVPLLILCLWNLYERKHKVASLLGVIYFGFTTHLVLIGYVVLTYLLILLIYMLIKDRGIRKEKTYFYIGIILLVVSYVVVNKDLFLQLLFGTTDFVSHRVEFYNYTEGINVWQNIVNCFLYGEGAYAPSLHWYILPFLIIITIIQGVRYNKLSDDARNLFRILLITWGAIIITAIIYGLVTSPLFLEWQNKQSGVLHYFQFERYIWIYPTLWWLMAGVGIGILWNDFKKISNIIKLLIILIAIFPTINLLKTECVLYDNINQYNNGSAITGMPTWEEYYMEELLQAVDEHIGRELETYRIAHLGLSPAPSLVYGFYTIDGYSNNYSLEYKYAFREVIAAELDKNDMLAKYFDSWGSRCYLYTAESGDYSKYSDYQFENLELNYEQMKALGCDYILSAKEIVSGNDGLILEGVFSSDTSNYEIWLYYIE